MNAFDFTTTDGTLDVSPTVATLDVRGALSRLRRILSPGYYEKAIGGWSGAIGEARDALDDLESDLVAAFLRFDGWVDPGNAEATEQRAKDLEEERDDEEKRADAAEARLEEYLQADEDTVEHVLASLLSEQAKHDAEIERSKQKAADAVAASEVWRKEAGVANASRAEMYARMGNWEKDQTAAESSDRFRDMFERACRERDAVRLAVREGLASAAKVVGKSPTRREALAEAERAIREALAKVAP
jgi:hypothetical protein